jgi:hypothetical protein
MEVLIGDSNTTDQNRGGPTRIPHKSTICQAFLNVTGPQTTKRILVKLDTCALINLSHSQHLTDVKRCEAHGLQPIRLKGIGGTTVPYSTAGVLTATTHDGQHRTGVCYVVDTPVAGDKSICLIGLRTLVDWGINLQHHMLDALQGCCSPLRLLQGRRSSETMLANVLLARTESSHRSDSPHIVESGATSVILDKWLTSCSIRANGANSTSDPDTVFIADRAVAATIPPCLGNS